MSARGTLTVTDQGEACAAANLGFWPTPYGMEGAEATVACPLGFRGVLGGTGNVAIGDLPFAGTLRCVGLGWLNNGEPRFTIEVDETRFVVAALGPWELTMTKGYAP